jgi:hypothetical protein
MATASCKADTRLALVEWPAAKATGSRVVGVEGLLAVVVVSSLLLLLLLLLLLAAAWRPKEPACCCLCCSAVLEKEAGLDVGTTKASLKKKLPKDANNARQHRMEDTSSFMVLVLV